MKKSRFAGLTEAKFRQLEGEEEAAAAEKTEEKEPKNKPEKLVSKSASKLASKQSSKAARRKKDEAEEWVGVTIKIPETKRIWWNVQAKLQRTTVTEAIIEALDKRFGEPQF